MAEIAFTYEELAILLELLEDSIAEADSAELRAKLMDMHSKVLGQSLKAEEASNDSE